MEAFMGIALALQAVVSLVVGVRLLLLSRRTRRLPEFALGFANAGLPAVGFPMMFGAGLLDQQGIPGAVAVHALGGIGAGIALTMGLVFTWKVFRPSSKSAMGFVASAGVAFMVVPQLATLAAHQHGFAEVDSHIGLWRLGVPIFGGLGQLWTAWESLRAHFASRKQMRIGLSEPQVCNRFLLFSLGATASLCAQAGLMASMLLASGPMETPWFVGLVAVVGIIQSISLVLAFMPPQWYTRRVESRAASLMT